MTKRRTWHYYTNIVAQLVQSRSRMNWHLTEKTLILRFDFQNKHSLISINAFKDMSNIFNKTVLYSSFEFGNFVESLSSQ